MLRLGQAHDAVELLAAIELLNAGVSCALGGVPFGNVSHCVREGASAEKLALVDVDKGVSVVWCGGGVCHIVKVVEG